MKISPALLALIALLLPLFGCSGTLEVGIERTPTPDHGATATLSALVNENARLATQIARQTTPTPPPPDLGQLAYVQGGDIWIKKLPDGNPIRLTTDGRNSQPRWSPSGQWLAFRQERQMIVEQPVPCDFPNPRQRVCSEPVNALQPQVWLIGADGNDLHALAGAARIETFAWSPTTDRLAYVSAGGELEMIRADQSSPTSLVARDALPNGTGQISRIAWSPDGNWIGYQVKSQPSDSASASQGIWKVSADGKSRVELYSSRAANNGESLLAGWSPLARNVLFWQNDANAVSSIDGLSLFGLSADKNASDDDALKLTNEAVLTYSDFVAPAPTGTVWEMRGSLALVVGAGRSTWTNKRVYIDSAPITPRDMAAISPSWSPDGSQIAYSAMPDQASLQAGEAVPNALMQRHIWIVNTLGGAPARQLTDASYRDERPLWSRDGSFLLFARMDARGRTSLWMLPSRGGTPLRVVEELTPAVDPAGFFGRVEWDNLFDWWRGRATG